MLSKDNSLLMAGITPEPWWSAVLGDFNPGIPPIGSTRSFASYDTRISTQSDTQSDAITFWRTQPVRLVSTDKYPSMKVPVLMNPSLTARNVASINFSPFGIRKVQKGGMEDQH